MKFRLLLCCLFIAQLVSARQQDTAQLRSAAVKVQKTYAPDKRSVYFSLNMRKDTVYVESSSAEALKALEDEAKSLTGINLKSTLLPSKALNGMEFAVANLSVCNNRVNPSNSAEMATQMILGTPVEVLKKQGGYYLVKTPDGYISWTDGSALGLMDKASFDDWKNAEKVVYTADYGHALSAANLSSTRISDLVEGNILRLLGTEKNFYKVQFPDKRIAFIPKAQAAPYKKWIKRPDPDAAKILATAQTLMGVPYLWGGTSVKGVDCSGFTKTAYFLNGIIIPRDASQQALVGEAVDIVEGDSISVEKCLKNLQPGDLLFFSGAKRRGVIGGRVSHTAIYMGEGQFIQSSGMVKINSLVPGTVNFDGQVHTLVGARRILNEIGKPEISRIADHPWYALN